MKKLTVITSTYNRSEYNLASIESILSQTYQDFQYIVVNDGSTDDTAQMLDKIQHPNLTVIHQKNKGFTNTLVDVLQTVETPYVALHDAGDIAHPQRLEKQIQLLESDDALGAVGCHIRVFNTDGQLIDVWKLPPQPEEAAQILLMHNYFSHGEVMFRRSAYVRAGGYRRFFKFAQDYDLWLRMSGFAKLARVDEFLYDQLIIPNTSVSSDYQKVESQGMFAAFAAYLAQHRLVDQPDELDLLGETAFTNFQNLVSQEFKDKISQKLIDSAKFDYLQNQNHQSLWSAACRAVELNPRNWTARLYLEVAKMLCVLDRMGLQPISKQLDRRINLLIVQRQRQRITSRLNLNYS